MLNNEEKLLPSGDIGLFFRKFAVPGILGLLFIDMQPMVDEAVLGNFVGPDALAGLNLVVPVYTFMSASPS